MISVPELLAKKRDGATLHADDLRHVLTGYQRGTVPDYQISALLMAVCCRGMSDVEAAVMMDTMLHSGEMVDLSSVPRCKVDKHSTGGVGDKVSLSLAPLVASLGVCVPMVSGRALGHTGGTLDKLESCPGFRVDLPLRRYQELVATVGAAMIGQTAELAPLDKKLYALRDVTGTVESIPLIACSIMSKKLAEGIDSLVLDVKVGNGAFMRNPEDARRLAQTMIAIGARANKAVVALLTNMDQPLGHAVGNALEWREATGLLHGGKGPADYRECVLALAAEMLILGKAAATLKQARALAEDALLDGRALAKWRQMVTAQGGDASYVDAPEKLHPAPFVAEVKALSSGTVAGIDTRGVGLLAIALGAGRGKLGDVIDPAVGFEIFAKVGQAIQLGEVIATVHARTKDQATDFALRLSALIEIGQASVQLPELVRERIESRA